MTSKSTYKVLDLFGNEEIRFINRKRSNSSLFDDYESFVNKFEPKKTTDDCYTPKEVYDIVVKYVNRHYNLKGKQIIRPFFPGGDYESVDYPDNCVVIDNPPFSIITKIVKFYISKDVKFFLFAPHLTLFGSDIDCTHIVASASIIYENGANVKTSFLSNLFGDKKVIGDADLYAELEAINERNKANLPKYDYPSNVLTVSKVAYCVEKGVSISIDKSHVKHYRALDAQKPHGKTIFGSGFLISDEAANIVKKATEKAAETVNKITWELSEKETEIIKSLGQEQLT